MHGETSDWFCAERFLREMRPLPRIAGCMPRCALKSWMGACAREPACPPLATLLANTGCRAAPSSAHFEQLKSEGYVEGTLGSGTYVSKVLPDELLQVASDNANAELRAQRKQRRRMADYGRRVDLFTGFEIRRSRAFRANLPALDLFPTSLWAQLTARRWRRASASLLLGCESARISSVARGGSGLPGHIAWRKVRAGASCDRLRRPGSTGFGGAAFSESR